MDEETVATFRRVRWIHLGFVAFVVYLPFSFVLLHRPDPVIQNDGGWLWPSRAVLAVLSAYALIALEIVVRRQRGQRRAKPAFVVRFPSSAEPAASNALLRMLFSEAVAIYGLLLFILWGQPADLFAFCGASLAALVWHLPLRSRWAHELQAERGRE